MSSVTVLTTTIRPEMVGLCRWLIERQTWPDVHHIIGIDTRRKGDRWSALAMMVADKGWDSDWFMLMDDDDYIGPEFIERCISRAQGDVYGEIPCRTYHVPSRRYGEGRKRKRLFSTFTLFRAAARDAVGRALAGTQPAAALEPILLTQKDPPHAEDLVIVRGAMADPGTAITTRKNVSGDNLPNEDHNLDVFTEWVGKEAVEKYLECARG